MEIDLVDVDTQNRSCLMKVRVHSHARFANDTGIKWMYQTSAAMLSKITDAARAKDVQ